MISLEDLQSICPAQHESVLRGYVDLVNGAMDEFDINTPERECMWLAQVAHESEEFRYVAEIASGHAYEGRTDLGNIHPGDGVRYKGRGLIQITGLRNYLACGQALGEDLVGSPERLEQPELAARSAGWYWQMDGLNELADRGDFLRITKRINGGTNGWSARQAYLERARRVIV